MNDVILGKEKTNYSLKKKDKHTVLVEKQNGQNLEVFTFNNTLIKNVKDFVFSEKDKHTVLDILKQLEKK